MTKQTAEPDSMPPSAGTSLLRRWLPPLVLLALGLCGYGLGLHRYLSLSTLAEHREALRQGVEAHFALALAAFALTYAGVVALSIPGAGLMSLAGGFLFGWALSAPVTILSATAGAAIVFQIVRTSFGAALAERAGPLVARLSQGFADNAFGLLLFLRLTPVFPFWAVNAVAGLCRISFRSFVLATAIGIIPGSYAYAVLGAGLDKAIDAQIAAHQACVAAKGEANCALRLEASALLAPELLLGLTALGFVSLIPVALRFVRRPSR